MLRGFSVVVGLLVAGIVLGCGNDDSETATPTLPAGEAGTSDEEYLAALCTGLDRFSPALLEAESVDEMVAVVEEYIETLEAVEPPADVQPFHDSFISYLTESLDEPTELVNRPPPLPEESVRERLAEQEASVEECEGLTFFQSAADEPER